MDEKRLGYFLAKVNKTDNCWLWTGCIDKDGYAKFWHNKQVTTAHRVAYEHWVENIKEGFEVDHLCKVRNCVNPEHLRQLSKKDHMLKTNGIISNHYRNRTHCKNGHEFKEGSFYLNKNARKCKQCTNNYQKAYQLRKKSKKD